MASVKQRLGDWLIPRLPINQHVFRHLRLELNAIYVRCKHKIQPSLRGKVKDLQVKKNLLVNVGCGPFGKDGWVNLDLFSCQGVSLIADTRRGLPLAQASCIGIHVEHFFEHLSPHDEAREFLADCLRCLEDGGILRVIVPDAEAYVRAYLSGGWQSLNALTCGGDSPEKEFRCKMDALNHVFLQEWEHYGGYDFERLELALRDVGFRSISRCDWGKGQFPVAPIDREQHRPYSLYVEAVK